MKCVLRSAILLFSLVFSGNFDTASAQAASPRVQFDAATTVECRDVTTDEFRQLNPTQSLLEAEFRISMLVTAGSEADIKDVMIVVQNPERRLRVVDYFPKNELASEIAGTIQRQETSDKATTYDAGISTTSGLGTAPVGASVTPSLGGHWSNRQGTSEIYHKLPPKKLVLAAGTMNGGQGVFFKLHPTSQDSLQGAHSYKVMFAAPRDWRIDRVTLSCHARGYSKVLFVKQEETSGRAEMTVSLYRAGDLAAQHAAQRVGNSYTPPAAASADGSVATRKMMMFE